MNINTSTKNMFSVPLIQMEVANWQEKKKKLLEMYDKVKIEYKDNVWTNYHDNYKNLNQDICLLLKDEILELHSIFGFNKTQVSSVWFERSFKNDSHCPHNHGGFGYSSVCFIEYDKNCHQATNFIAPFLDFIGGNKLEYCPDVEEGTIIFFPSAIIHHTYPNKSDKQRTILSFNLDVLEII